jgi:hypothetical protein
MVDKVLVLEQGQCHKCRQLKTQQVVEVECLNCQQDFLLIFKIWFRGWTHNNYKA